MMTFHYDRISVKEGIDTETYNFINETVSITLLMKQFQKNIMHVVYSFITKVILTIENGPMIDVIKSY